MIIKKILGNLVLQHGNLSIAKLTNGCYAVGNFFYGKDIQGSEQFYDFNEAFQKWADTIDNLPRTEFE